MNDRTALCEGCFRTIDEIAGWLEYSPKQKRTVLRKIDERCERLLDGTFFE